jgi:hypothetical protein
MWAAKFLSYAHCEGFKKDLLGLDVPPPESEDASNDLLKIILRKSNNLAFFNASYGS